MILGPVSALICQKNTKEEKSIIEEKKDPRDLIVIPILPISSLFCPPLHRHLLPEVIVLASTQHCGAILRALLDERWVNEEEKAWGLVCLLLLDKGQELCQETCAMSLTRVWMSCRHRGHVSNCKAHSIHIPLQEHETKRKICLAILCYETVQSRKTWIHTITVKVLWFVWSIQIRTYPCPQGRSSVSAMTSQHSVQQLSRMLTCLSNARRRCLKNTHKSRYKFFLLNVYSTVSVSGDNNSGLLCNMMTYTHMLWLNNTQKWVLHVIINIKTININLRSLKARACLNWLLSPRPKKRGKIVY